VSPTCAGAGRRTGRVIAEGKACTWRLLDGGAAPGPANLALDEALFLLARDGRTPPTVRFYAWSSPAVSVGYFQSWERELDEEACRSRGLGIYRRITGGRAVLHSDEVTYSVVCGESGGFFGDGVQPAYRKIALALAGGLDGLGVDVEVAAPSRPRGQGGGGRHPSCFSSSIGYEISHRGKKLVGSAQKRQGDALLQHGSVLLGDHGPEFLELLKAGHPAAPGDLKMASLSSALGRRPSHGEVTEKLAEGFRSSWGVVLEPGELSEEERSLADRLEHSRYRSRSWNGPRRTGGERGLCLRHVDTPEP
jgi:lipoate-protein ligase A